MPPTPDLAGDLEMESGHAPEKHDTELSPNASSMNVPNHTPPSTKRYSSPNPKFSLPPPPSRPRRIIQMKPAVHKKDDQKPCSTAPNSKGLSNGSVLGASVSPNAGRKGPNPSTAAGKKMARRTAHSVIERRRRSKMNEEFSTLKGMIPACQGQEMHKLAILQASSFFASIDYLRYLEGCITDLKAANCSNAQLQRPPPLHTSLTDDAESDNGDDQESDVDMKEAPPSDVSPVTTVFQSSHASYMSPRSLIASPALNTSMTASPATKSAMDKCRNTSILQASASTTDLPSPAFTARRFSQYSMSGPASLILSSSMNLDSRSLETSPAILPVDADHDASAALLMLKRDRRGSKESTTSRALSVKDLLSS